MRRAAFVAMALTLWRDRPAFALTFLLPPAIFAIFATALATASGGGLRLVVGVAAASDIVSQRIVSGVEAADAVREVRRYPDETTLADAVARGEAAVGLAVARTDAGAPRLTLYREATREAAALVLRQILADLRPGARDAAEGVFTETAVNPANATVATAAYYAAGVAMLFLVLSSFQGALTLHEERDAGVVERLAATRAGVGPTVDGKFAFIWIQGIAQTVVILAAAALGFGVDLTFAPALLAAATAAAAFAAAGLGLGVALACRSRAQAHAVGAILALVLAALGGSMAPAFLMPEAVQAVGALTPNGLGIRAFGAALWTGGGLTLAGPALLGLAAWGVGGLAVARLLAPRTLAVYS